MIDALIIIGCIAAGVLLLLVEFTILPGITIAGISAVILFIYSIFLAYAGFGIWGALLTASLIIIGAPFLVVRLFKGKAGKSMRLSSQITGKVNTVINDKIAVGQKGITLTRLGPVGQVQIGEIEMEAKSTGPMIDAGQEIEIIQTDHNQVTVQPVVPPKPIVLKKEADNEE